MPFSFLTYICSLVCIKEKFMLVATVSDFKRDINNYLEKVINDVETLMINRGKGKTVVVMSLDEYNSIITTQHELSSKKNEARLDSAIKKFKSIKK